MRRLALAAAVLAAGALAAPAAAARVPERGFDLILAAVPPIEPETPTLFSLDPATGERMRLSRTTRAHESDPTPSPNGRLLAFVRGALGTAQTVWIARADGSRPRLVGEGTSPAWSPDSRRLAYAGPEGVLVAAASGGAGRLVGPGGAFPAFSPTGGLLAYLVSGGSVPSRLEVVEPPGGTPRTVLAEAGPFAWAPDGRAIAVRVGLATTADRGPLLLVGLDGRVAWRAEPHLLSHAPAFAPDGASIALLEHEGVSLYDAADGTRRPLAPDPGCASPAAVSPDGTRLACLGQSDASGGPVVRVRTLASARTTTWSWPEREATALAWRRDGRLVVGWTASPQRDLELLRVNAASGRTIALTDDRLDQTDPIWSPDGTRLLFRQGVRVMVARADGSGRRRIPVPAGNHYAGIDWSPDGRNVLLMRSDGRVWLWPLGGGRLVETALPGTTHMVEDAVDWSSRGELAYASDEGVVVVPLVARNGRLRPGTPRLVAPGGFAPRWSPDGRRLVHVRVTRDGCGVYCDVARIATIARDGSDERVLLASPRFQYVRDVAWVGNRVALLDEDVGSSVLTLLRPEGRTSTLPLGLPAVRSFDWRAPVRRP